MTTIRATDGRLTRADLDALPEDGLRHELVDGAFVMTPAPGTRHQVITLNVAWLLKSAQRPGLRTLVAPLDVALPTGDVVQPDVLVAKAEDLTDKDVSGAPVLVVEVLSPATRRRDLGDKLTAYRDAGVPHYWVVDPDGPRLLAHDLVDGEYVVVADVCGEDAWTATRPLQVEVVPARLLD